MIGQNRTHAHSWYLLAILLASLLGIAIIVSGISDTTPSVAAIPVGIPVSKAMAVQAGQSQMSKAGSKAGALIPLDTPTNTPTPTSGAVLVGHVTWQSSISQTLPVSLTLTT